MDSDQSVSAFVDKVETQTEREPEIPSVARSPGFINSAEPLSGQLNFNLSDIVRTGTITIYKTYDFASYCASRTKVVNYLGSEPGVFSGRNEIDEEDEREELVVKYKICLIPKGTVLFHGTNSSKTEWRYVYGKAFFSTNILAPTRLIDENFQYDDVELIKRPRVLEYVTKKDFYVLVEKEEYEFPLLGLTTCDRTKESYEIVGRITELGKWGDEEIQFHSDYRTIHFMDHVRVYKFYGGEKNANTFVPLFCNATAYSAPLQLARYYDPEDKLTHYANVYSAFEFANIEQVKEPVSMTPVVDDPNLKNLIVKKSDDFVHLKQIIMEHTFKTHKNEAKLVDGVVYPQFAPKGSTIVQINVPDMLTYYNLLSHFAAEKNYEALLALYPIIATAGNRYGIKDGRLPFLGVKGPKKTFMDFFWFDSAIATAEVDSSNIQGCIGGHTISKTCTIPPSPYRHLKPQAMLSLAFGYQRMETDSGITSKNTLEINGMVTSGIYTKGFQNSMMLESMCQVLFDIIYNLVKEFPALTVIAPIFLQKFILERFPALELDSDTKSFFHSHYKPAPWLIWNCFEELKQIAQIGLVNFESYGKMYKMMQYRKFSDCLTKARQYGQYLCRISVDQWECPKRPEGYKYDGTLFRFLNLDCDRSIKKLEQVINEDVDLYQKEEFFVGKIHPAFKWCLRHLHFSFALSLLIGTTSIDKLSQPLVQAHLVKFVTVLLRYKLRLRLKIEKHKIRIGSEYKLEEYKKRLEGIEFLQEILFANPGIEEHHLQKALAYCDKFAVKRILNQRCETNKPSLDTLSKLFDLLKPHYIIVNTKNLNTIVWEAHMRAKLLFRELTKHIYNILKVRDDGQRFSVSLELEEAMWKRFQFECKEYVFQLLFFMESGFRNLPYNQVDDKLKESRRHDFILGCGEQVVEVAKFMMRNYVLDTPSYPLEVIGRVLPHAHCLLMQLITKESSWRNENVFASWLTIFERLHISKATTKSSLQCFVTTSIEISPDPEWLLATFEFLQKFADLVLKKLTLCYKPEEVIIKNLIVLRDSQKMELMLSAVNMFARSRGDRLELVFDKYKDLLKHLAPIDSIDKFSTAHCVYLILRRFIENRHPMQFQIVKFVAELLSESLASTPIPLARILTIDREMFQETSLFEMVCSFHSKDTKFISYFLVNGLINPFTRQPVQKLVSNDSGEEIIVNEKSDENTLETRPWYNRFPQIDFFSLCAKSEIIKIDPSLKEKLITVKQAIITYQLCLKKSHVKPLLTKAVKSQSINGFQEEGAQIAGTRKRFRSGLMDLDNHKISEWDAVEIAYKIHYGQCSYQDGKFICLNSDPVEIPDRVGFSGKSSVRIARKRQKLA